MDNVLLDAGSAKLWDVDWGVCFDAGHRLRVPEKVPFRLTPCVARPLGPEGASRSGVFVESAQKLACQLSGDAGRSLAELLALCCRDARVEWRATLGHGKRLKGPEDGQGAPAAPHHDRFATLALSAARCFEQRRKLVADGLHRGDVLAAALDARSAALDALAVAQGGHGDAEAPKLREKSRADLGAAAAACKQASGRRAAAEHAMQAAARARQASEDDRAAFLDAARRRSAGRDEVRALLASHGAAVVGELNKRGAVLLAAGSVSTADGSNAPPLPLGQLREIFAAAPGLRDLVAALRDDPERPLRRVAAVGFEGLVVEAIAHCTDERDLFGRFQRLEGRRRGRLQLLPR